VDRRNFWCLKPVLQQVAKQRINSRWWVVYVACAFIWRCVSWQVLKRAACILLTNPMTKGCAVRFIQDDFCTGKPWSSGNRPFESQGKRTRIKRDFAPVSESSNPAKTSTSFTLFAFHIKLLVICALRNFSTRSAESRFEYVGIVYDFWMEANSMPEEINVCKMRNERLLHVYFRLVFQLGIGIAQCCSERNSFQHHKQKKPIWKVHSSWLRWWQPSLVFVPACRHFRFPLLRIFLTVPMVNTAGNKQRHRIRRRLYLSIRC